MASFRSSSLKIRVIEGSAGKSHKAIRPKPTVMILVRSADALIAFNETGSIPFDEKDHSPGGHAPNTAQTEEPRG